MSKSVETKVVELRFDNTNFESKVSQSLKTLQTLEKQLNAFNNNDALDNLTKQLNSLGKTTMSQATESMSGFTNAAKDSSSKVKDLGFTVDGANEKFSGLRKVITAFAILNPFSGILDATKNLQGYVSSFTMEPMNEEVETTVQKFSALEIAGYTAVSKITVSLMNFASKALSTVVSAGKQRALNVEQANFQFEGMGIAADEAKEKIMNAVLGTAYSYDQAAKVASQLAASNTGVTVSYDELGKEVKSVNDAMTKHLMGIAGVASMTGRSFDEIGQIFTTVAGNGKLMTEQLNQFSYKGLNVAAVLAKALKTTEANVRDMVSKGKISFETFSNAMADAFGSHAKDSTKMFTGALEDVKAALARLGEEFWAPMLEHFRDLLNACTPAVDSLHTALKPLINDVTRLFGKLVDFIEASVLPSIYEDGSRISTLKFEWLNPLIKGIEYLGSVLGKLGKLVIKVGKILSPGFVLIFKAVWNIVKSVANAFSTLIVAIEPLGGVIEKIATIIGEIIYKISDILVNGHIIKNLIDDIAAAITWLSNAIKGLNLENAKNVIKGLGDIIQESFGVMLDAFKFIVEKITNIFGDLEKVAKLITAIAGLGATAIWSMMVDRFTKPAKLLKNILKETSSWLDTFKNSLSTFIDKIAEMPEKIGEVLETLTSSLKTLIADIKANILYKIAMSMIVLAGALAIISAIDPEKLKGSLKAFSLLFILLSTAFVIIQKVMTTANKMVKWVGDFKKKTFDLSVSRGPATTLLAIAASVAILAIALKKVSEIDEDAIFRSWLTLGGLMVFMVAACAALSTEKTKKFASGIWQLVLFAESLNILANAMKILASVAKDETAFGNAMGAILVLIATMGIVAKALTGAKMPLRASIGVVAIAFAMVQMSNALAVLGTIDKSALIRGVGTIAILMLMTGALLGFVSVLKAKNKAAKQIVTLSVALILLAVALDKMIEPIKQLGALPIYNLAKGLGVLAVSLSILLVSLAVLKSIKGKAGQLIGLGVGLMFVAKALDMLIDPLQALATMSWGELAKGGAVLTLFIGIALGAFAVLEQINKKKLFFNAANNFIKFGAALVVISASFVIFSAALKLLSTIEYTALINGLGAMTLALTEVVIVFLILQKLPVLKIATAFLGMALSIGILAASVVWIGSLPWGALLKGLIPLAAMLISIIGIAVIINKIGSGVSVVLFAFAAALTALSLSLLLIQQLSLGEIGKFFLTLVGTLGVLVGFAVLVDLLSGAFIGAALALTIFGVSLIVVGTGMMLIYTYAALIINAITAFIEAIRGVSTEGPEEMKNAGVNTLNGFTEGLFSFDIKEMIATWFREHVINPVKEVLGINSPSTVFADIGVNLIKGLWNGAKGMVDWVVGKFKGLGRSILKAIKKALGINSPSKEFAKVGKYSVQGLVKGLEDSADDAKTAAYDVGAKTLESMKAAISTINDTTSDLDANPRITPVVDLSNVYDGFSKIGSLASENQAIGISASMNGKVSKWESFQNSMLAGVRDAIASNAANVTDPNYNFTTHVELDGREIARGTATYTQQELNKLQVRSNRKLGLV